MLQHPLVTTAWLHEHLQDRALRIVDIRGHVLPATEPLPHYFNHHADYLHSHILGAVFVDWVHEITDPADPHHAQIAKPERYAAVMSRLGIDSDTVVVAYDDANGMFAARLWWSLRYYGHEQVVVLDGGWQKWLAENRPTTAEKPVIQPTTVVPKPNPAIYRAAADILPRLQSDLVLMDVRTPEEFTGQASRAKRKGHIPQAINLPRGRLVHEDGTMLEPAALRQHFAAIGITPNTPEVVVYCNGGVSASYGMLALQVAGITRAAVYDGSWKDWGNDDTKPIEI